MKGLRFSWFGFPISTLEAYNFLSCIHFDQDDLKRIGRGNKILYKIFILIWNSGALHTLRYWCILSVVLNIIALVMPLAVVFTCKMWPLMVYLDLFSLIL